MKQVKVNLKQVKVSTKLLKKFFTLTIGITMLVQWIIWCSKGFPQSCKAFLCINSVLVTERSFRLQQFCCNQQLTKYVAVNWNVSIFTVMHWASFWLQQNCCSLNEPQHWRQLCREVCLEYCVKLTAVIISYKFAFQHILSIAKPKRRKVRDVQNWLFNIAIF